MADKALLEKWASDTAESNVGPRWAKMEDPHAHITVVGLSYKTAPVHLRERVSFSKDEVGDALSIVSAQAGQSVILSTCNRTEVYSVVSDPDIGFDAVRHFLAEYHGLEPHAISPYVYEFADVHAARHLHLVASGLDSMVLGEPQIQGQVREAMIAASKIDSNSAPAPLSRLFHSALRAGRRVREETSIGQDSPSLGQAAVELAHRLLGDLNGLSVLLIGAGEAGKLVAKEFMAVGGADLVVVNRTEERGAELAMQLGARAVPFSEIGKVLHDTDVVICAASAPEFLVTGDMVSRASQGRGSQPMYLFDLTVPRNIDPSVGALKDVYLFNVDDIGLNTSEPSGTGVIEAKEIIEEELGNFLEWWDSLDAVPLIKNLQEHAESIRAKEVDRAIRKMPGLPSEQREQLEAMTCSIVKKLLHSSIVSLKNETAGNSRRRASRARIMDFLAQREVA